VYAGLFCSRPWILVGCHPAARDTLDLAEKENAAPGHGMSSYVMLNLQMPAWLSRDFPVNICGTSCNLGLNNHTGDLTSALIPASSSRRL